jgi:hypothetical protein
MKAEIDRRRNVGVRESRHDDIADLPTTLDLVGIRPSGSVDGVPAYVAQALGTRARMTLACTRMDMTFTIHTNTYPIGTIALGQ